MASARPPRKTPATEQLTPLELDIKELWESVPAPVQPVQERLAADRPLAYNRRCSTSSTARARCAARSRNWAYHYESTVSRLQAARR